LLYAALLASLHPEKISIIAMQELTRISALDVRCDGVPLARIATNIGACLEREVFAQQIFKKEFLAYVRLNPKQRNQILHNRRAFTRLMERTRLVLDDSIEARQAGWIPSWSTSLKAEVRQGGRHHCFIDTLGRNICGE
jgi:DNA-directed RNA polymerase